MTSDAPASRPACAGSSSCAASGRRRREADRLEGRLQRARSASQARPTRPLVGFLTDRRSCRTATAVSLAGWANPVLEAEIAVHLARDVPGDATRGGRPRRDRTASGPRSSSPTSTRRRPTCAAILAGNIYHRGVVLGPVDESRRPPRGSAGACSTSTGASRSAATDDPAAYTGEVVEVVRATAEQLAACGRRLRAGEFAICGSVVPAFQLSRASG